ncbi:helix-turn-helix domain-containing protein [Propionicicella superfundia]|nr:helix-turn-helix domain-containing protein [Propionicicella superfundia]
MRTAKASGESVRSIAERFGKHRSTVWRYTKGSAS